MMMQPSLHDNTHSGAILRQLNLGQHTLVIMEDNSIDVLTHEALTSECTENGTVHLDSLEAYRLFVSLHEQFR